MYREDRPHGKRKREKDRMDPIKSQAPERGSAAQLKPGTGGNIGVTGGTLLTQYILKNQVRCSQRCQSFSPPIDLSAAVLPMSASTYSPWHDQYCKCGVLLEKH